MILEYSYDPEFKLAFRNLKKLKYAEELSNLDGIGEQLDVAKFSKKFFGRKGRLTTADISVDANSNVDDVNIVQYPIEVSKPLHRLNAYYLLWKYANNIYSEEKAYEMLKAQFTKEIYINDFHTFGYNPYSYHPDTSLVIKIKTVEHGDKIIYNTMKGIFEDYKNFIQILPDREQIEFKNTKDKLFVLDENDKFIELEKILRHKNITNLLEIETKKGNCTIVTSDHPVILKNKKIKKAEELQLDDSLYISNSKLPLNSNLSISLDLSYIIGFFIGDGTFRFFEGKVDKSKICQKEIEESRIYESLTREFSNLSVVKRKEGNYVCSFGDKKLSQQFLDWGIGRYSEERKLPTNVLSWPKKQLKALISGLIDSEGNVHPGGYITIKVTSFALVQQLGELLRNLDCCNMVRTSFIGIQPNKKGFKSNNELYKVSFRLKDKEFINLSDKVNKNQNIIYKKLGKIKDGRFESNKIHKIRQYEKHEEWVYDITTETGQFHSQGLIQHNCFNYSCMDVVCMGLPFVTRIKSRPPKHLSSFMGQMLQFVVYTSNSSVGAIGLADLLICSSWYIKKLYNNKSGDIVLFEPLIWEQVKQEFQSFIYSVNQPSRNGSQSPFTNISIFDNIFLEKLCNEYTFPDGTHPNIELVKKLQEIFVDLMNSILRETPATFPITTACFATNDKNEILDEEFLSWVVNKNLEFGFMNIYAGKTSTLSSCCRLRSEANNEYFNMFGSGGTKIGSVGVVTLNLPRIAYNSKNKEEFLNKLEELVLLASQINWVKRSILQKRIDNNHAPLYTLGIIVLKKQYSTTGIIGVNEAVEILGMDILKEEGQQFVVGLLKKINEVNEKQQKKLGCLHNCEQVPGESSAVVLAQADEILEYNKKYSIYSNQFIPLIKQADILDRIKLQGLFDSYMSGGAICHLNFSEKITDEEFLKNLLKESIKLGVVYQAINYSIQRCQNEHVSIGKTEKCPICSGKITDYFTRIVGFLVNTKNWHKVRREEDWPKRQWYGQGELK